MRVRELRGARGRRRSRGRALRPRARGRRRADAQCARGRGRGPSGHGRVGRTRGVGRAVPVAGAVRRDRRRLRRPIRPGPRTPGRVRRGRVRERRAQPARAGPGLGLPGGGLHRGRHGQSAGRRSTAAYRLRPNHRRRRRAGPGLARLDRRTRPRPGGVGLRTRLRASHRHVVPGRQAGSCRRGGDVPALGRRDRGRLPAGRTAGGRRGARGRTARLLHHHRPGGSRTPGRVRSGGGGSSGCRRGVRAGRTIAGQSRRWTVGPGASGGRDRCADGARRGAAGDRSGRADPGRGRAYGVDGQCGRFLHDDRDHGRGPGADG